MEHAGIADDDGKWSANFECFHCLTFDEENRFAKRNDSIVDAGRRAVMQFFDLKDHLVDFFISQRMLEMGAQCADQCHGDRCAGAKPCSNRNGG